MKTKTWGDLTAYQRRDAVVAIRTHAKTTRAFIGMVNDAGVRNMTEDKAEALDLAADLLEGVILGLEKRDKEMRDQRAMMKDVSADVDTIAVDTGDGRR